ncbi:MAG TPA: LamG-like jellyroll fold domain-containing protein, partial [Candidatus Tectomicrobia bacterium]
MAALAFLCSLFVFGFSARAVVGPYATDADTLLLFQFDDAAGQNVAASAGSLVSGGNKKAYAVNETTATTTPAAINSILGGSAYPGFGSAANFNYPGAVAGAMIGWDFNDSSAYDGDISSGTQSADRFNMSTLNIGNGGQTSWTMETLIKPTSTSVNQEIICTDSSASSRAFQFRINNAAQLEINFIGVSGLKFLPQIPTTGTHAYAANTWFHVAAAYDGTTLRFYWTKVDPSVASANLIGSTNLAIGTAAGALQGPLVIGNENR